MDWNDLKWFVAVVDAGSFREAATKTGLNHTTLSRRIRALEESLGTSLFERSPTGLKLTQAGEELRSSSEVLVAGVADLQRRLTGKDESPEGRVSVTYSDGFAAHIIEASAKIAQLYPEISITHINTEDFVDVGRREADIAIRAADNPPEDLLGRRIGTIRWALYGSKKLYPAAMKVEPASHDWIGFGGRWSKAAPARWLQENVSAERIRAKANDPQSIRELAAAGVGLGLLMCADGDRDPRLTRVGDWPGELPPMLLWLLIHPDTRNLRRIRVVADGLHDCLKRVEGAFVGDST